MQLARLARALYWFHPLAWLACRQLAIESEKACDDAVMRSGSPAPAYAAALVHIAASAQKSLLRHAVLHMARQSTLESRVRRVLDPRAPRVAFPRPRSSPSFSPSPPSPPPSASSAPPAAISPRRSSRNQTRRTHPDPESRSSHAFKSALDARQAIKDIQDNRPRRPNSWTCVPRCPTPGSGCRGTGSVIGRRSKASIARLSERGKRD